jgi:UDP-glucose 4-epimerase
MIFQAYGPGQAENAIIPSAVRAASMNQNFPMTSGNQERDWIYVDDVASGLTALLGSNLTAGKTVEFGTGKMTSTTDVVSEIYRLVGGTGKPMLGVLPDRPGEDVSQVATTSVTRDTIGWQATISLEEGLKHYLSSTKE